jgi:hypothetical protein
VLRRLTGTPFAPFPDLHEPTLDGPEPVHEPIDLDQEPLLLPRAASTAVLSDGPSFHLFGSALAGPRTAPSTFRHQWP